MSELLHHCHAVSCEREIPPILLMCFPHWKLVPKAVQFRVVAAYQKDQEITKNPSLLWCLAADDAVKAVAEKEGRTVRITFAGAFYPADPRNIGLQASGMGRTVRGGTR